MADTKKVLDLIKEHDVKYVDFRFTDPRGKWQHLAQHIATINEDCLTEGIMFDGSSIAGWKAINESDMILLPDCATAVMDPFAAQPSARHLLRRAGAADRPELRPRPALDRQERRGLSEDHRHRRHALFRARGRVLRVRRRALRPADERRLLRGQLRGRPLSLGQEDGRGQPRPPPADQGRLFPGAAGRCLLRPARRDADA